MYNKKKYKHVCLGEFRKIEGGLAICYRVKFKDFSLRCQRSGNKFQIFESLPIKPRLFLI